MMSNSNQPRRDHRFQSANLVVHVPKPRAATQSATVQLPTQHSPGGFGERFENGYAETNFTGFEHDFFFQRHAFECVLSFVGIKMIKK